jgi:hypothetical protein
LIETAHAAEVTEDKNEVESLVRSYFKDVPVLISVAQCESHFRHTLADGSVLKGTVDGADTGVMQINRRFHEKRAQSLGLDLFDLEDNLAYARILYNEQGTKPWSASAPCWRPEVAQR